MAKEPVNPVKSQDRAFDLWDTWQKYGYCMFPQQRRIYEQLAVKLEYFSTLEAGCGNGLGSGMLQAYKGRSEELFTATDVCEKNYKFAAELYPWIAFDHWDVLEPWSSVPRTYEAVVAVEVLEHVADPVLALKNMLGACTEELWFSTPNGTGKLKPPENPFHVMELTPRNVFSMLRSLGAKNFQLKSWEDFEDVGPDTLIDPLVYRVAK